MDDIFLLNYVRLKYAILEFVSITLYMLEQVQRKRNVNT